MGVDGIIKRYPSKNTVKLTAEIERLTGSLVSFDQWWHEHVPTLILRVGEREVGREMVDRWEPAEIDAVKRKLLVAARRDLTNEL